MSFLFTVTVVPSFHRPNFWNSSHEKHFILNRREMQFRPFLSITWFLRNVSINTKYLASPTNIHYLSSRILFNIPTSFLAISDGRCIHNTSIFTLYHQEREIWMLFCHTKTKKIYSSTSTSSLFISRNLLPLQWQPYVPLLLLPLSSNTILHYTSSLVS